jgi:hypothetical protein
MIAIKPIKDTISKARPISLNPNFKKKGPSAQNNNNIPKSWQLFHQILSLFCLHLY